MKRNRQTVVYQFDANNRATYRNQMVSGIQFTHCPESGEVDKGDIVSGRWNGKRVDSWSINHGTWYVYN